MSDEELVKLYNDKAASTTNSLNSLHIRKLRAVEAEAAARALEELAESTFLSYRINAETEQSETFERKKFQYPARVWMRDRATKYREGEM